jgi:hypothetical protein
MSSAIIKRLETLEAQMATRRSPTLIFCWTKTLADRISKALPGYTTVSIHGITGCSDDDAVEALIREDPVESERLDKLLAGIPPD